MLGRVVAPDADRVLVLPGDNLHPTRGDSRNGRGVLGGGEVPGLDLREDLLPRFLSWRPMVNKKDFFVKLWGEKPSLGDIIVPPFP